MSLKKRIDSVRVVKEVDIDAGFSWLGEFTDRQDDWSICRQAGEYVANLPDDYDFPERCREYRYFVPYAGGEAPGTADFQKYGKHDWERMEAYERKQWCFVGLRAEAKIVVNGICQTISSGGLWGIESDSEDAYFAEVAQEELHSLADLLTELGFTKRQINAAVKSHEMVEA